MKLDFGKAKECFTKLEANRWYWEFDNDYSRKFSIIEQAVNNWERTNRETLFYVMDIVQFMDEANRRIFKA